MEGVTIFQQLDLGGWGGHHGLGFEYVHVFGAHKSTGNRISMGGEGGILYFVYFGDRRFGGH